MGAPIPRTEQPNTECPFCGNVWQEHTLNQRDVCTAIMKQRMARHPEFSKSPIASILSKPVPCPVCTRLLGEHSNTDLDACEGKLRKRERGSTGLHVGGVSFALASGLRGEEDRDVAKDAQLHVRMMQAPCSICGKPRGDHTEAETVACALKRQLPQ
jgi:hypothetical protein